jgi:F-type H+-transporting ATPase subunit epsilon
MKSYDLHLEVITPETVVFEGYVKLVQVPGTEGTFTILQNHAPIVARLDKGGIRIVDESGKEDIIECGSGFLECRENMITILLD